jgi:hypothetical protein
MGSTFVLRSNTWAVDSKQPLTLIHVLLKLSEILVSLSFRHLAEVSVVKGIWRKAIYGQIQGIMSDSNYVVSCKRTSPPVWDLEYFDR